MFPTKKNHGNGDLCHRPPPPRTQHPFAILLLLWATAIGMLSYWEMKIFHDLANGTNEKQRHHQPGPLLFAAKASTMNSSSSPSFSSSSSLVQRIVSEGNVDARVGASQSQLMQSTSLESSVKVEFKEGGEEADAEANGRKNNNSNRDPHHKQQTPPLQQQQQQPSASSSTCRPLRDLTSLSTSTVQYPNADRPHFRQNSKYDQCLQFTCEWTNHTHCDTYQPTTIYNDPNKMPCCVHILRDMAHRFDQIMCHLELEYFTSYGMLLGLIRGDRLIPWTSDNDYIVTERTIVALQTLTEEERAVFERHGLSFFFDNFYYRLCVTPSFMGGELAEYWSDEANYKWYPLVHPYADVFIAREEEAEIEEEGLVDEEILDLEFEGGRMEIRDLEEAGVSSNKTVTTAGQQPQQQQQSTSNQSLATALTMVHQLGCAHPMSYYRPAKRIGVYNNSFAVSVPQNAEGVLERVYGPSWRVPDAKKSPHGDTKCKHRK
mmetsp:Transcript_33910/g.71308  ORF Transcript_33910/g.71308 Transcript_33910/m.71308 type:complete len:489 (+) Transcript_33910:231-1697(+)